MISNKSQLGSFCAVVVIFLMRMPVLSKGMDKGALEQNSMTIMSSNVWQSKIEEQCKELLLTEDYASGVKVATQMQQQFGAENFAKDILEIGYGYKVYKVWNAIVSSINHEPMEHIFQIIWNAKNRGFGTTVVEIYAPALIQQWKAITTEEAYGNHWLNSYSSRVASNRLPMVKRQLRIIARDIWNVKVRQRKNAHNKCLKWKNSAYECFCHLSSSFFWSDILNNYKLDFVHFTISELNFIFSQCDYVYTLAHLILLPTSRLAQQYDQSNILSRSEGKSAQLLMNIISSKSMHQFKKKERLKRRKKVMVFLSHAKDSNSYFYGLPIEIIKYYIVGELEYEYEGMTLEEVVKKGTLLYEQVSNQPSLDLSGAFPCKEKKRKATHDRLFYRTPRNRHKYKK